MDNLPTELIFHILSFLEPNDIIPLHLVSHRLHTLARDAQLWRGLCFENSGGEKTRRRKERQGVGERVEALLREPWVGSTTVQRAATVVASAATSGGAKGGEKVAGRERRGRGCNWDPTYPGELVDWYQEYIHRHGPISMSWLQQPGPADALGERREARGLGLLKGCGEECGNEGVVVAPLDDGSVCLWDLQKAWRGEKSGRGRVVARSKPNLLSVNGVHYSEMERDDRSKMTSTGVVECVSVNDTFKRAYFAVQSGLNEVDLQTLQVISHTRFPFSISALSESESQVPLTVGTTLSLHLHDVRVGHSSTIYCNGMDERCDIVAKFSGASGGTSAFQALFDSTGSDLATYAPLFQPGPVSILHSHKGGNSWDGRGDVYVAGRFPSILRYDRRMWPKLRGTIHSGARLCSITSLPYDFVLPEEDMSTESVRTGHPKPGTTLVACGEYNGKGSLELYGVPPQRCCSASSTLVLERPKYPFYRNRQTAAPSKLLSVATHGTRIVVSDGDGTIKWMERDGSMEVRRWNINSQEELQQDPYLFPRSRLSVFDDGLREVARKILPTNESAGGRHFNQDDLLVWTGERIGLVTFTKQPQFLPKDFEEKKETAEEAAKRRDERQYSQAMRLALSMQADEVRFMRGLGVMGLE